MSSKFFVGDFTRDSPLICIEKHFMNGGIKNSNRESCERNSEKTVLMVKNAKCVDFSEGK
jgi:hypothetical protein